MQSEAKGVLRPEDIQALSDVLAGGKVRAAVHATRVGRLSTSDLREARLSCLTGDDVPAQFAVPMLEKLEDVLATMGKACSIEQEIDELLEEMGEALDDLDAIGSENLTRFGAALRRDLDQLRSKLTPFLEELIAHVQ